MKLPDDKGHVRETAVRLLATSVDEVERVPSFAGNRVFKATTAVGEFFLKFAEVDPTAAEHAVLCIAAELGIPVPTIAGVDLDGTVTGCPCLAMRAVPGRPLNGDEALFAGVGPLLERLHDLRVQGFGSISPTIGGGVRGEDRTWFETLQRRTDAGRVVVEAGLVPGTLIDAVASAVEERPWESFEDSRLLHGDFHPRHVYADLDRITAIIDWGDATAGDPDYDIARILHSVILRSDLSTALAVASNGLPRERRDIDDQRLAKLLTYAAVFIVWSMHGEYESGSLWPAWWSIQTDALERVVDALAATR